jgi:hypothetical protein
MTWTSNATASSLSLADDDVFSDLHLKTGGLCPSSVIQKELTSK